MQLNISMCLYTEDEDFVLVIYNPLSQKVVSPIRVPVQQGKYSVVDLTGMYRLTIINNIVISIFRQAFNQFFFLSLFYLQLMQVMILHCQFIDYIPYC